MNNPPPRLTSSLPSCFFSSSLLLFLFASCQRLDLDWQFLSIFFSFFSFPPLLSFLLYPPFSGLYTMSKSRRNVRFPHRNSNDNRRMSVSSDVSDAPSEAGSPSKNNNSNTLAGKSEGNGASKPSTIPEEVS